MKSVGLLILIYLLNSVFKTAWFNTIFFNFIGKNSLGFFEQSGTSDNGNLPDFASFAQLNVEFFDNRVKNQWQRALPCTKRGALNFSRRDKIFYRSTCRLSRENGALATSIPIKASVAEIG